MSKVYINVDSKNRVIGLDGGYSIANVDLETWILIDEGEGDKYNLCQSHYLDTPLTTDDGIYRYKYINNTIAERTEEEINADRAKIPPVPPTEAEQIAGINETIDMILTEVIPSLFE
ncbi:MAG: hypothetical protein KBS66_07450 [Eubacterium sp.]|nr:hypothetical protein [Candidatus Colimonas fimequi]